MKDPSAGILLKLERLKQGKGQKEICHGICVTSYLSKIEHNLVQPDKSILQQLYERLGIQYQYDSEFLETSEKLISSYFYNQLYGIEGTEYEKLNATSTLLSYSPLALDWMLIQSFEGEGSAVKILSELEDVMTERQLARYYLLQPLDKGNLKQVLILYKKAHGILNNSFSLLKLMAGHWEMGEYDKVNEYAEQCISLALEEGNTWSMAICYELQGCVYAGLNIEALMETYYIRSIHLLQNTLWKEHLSITYYNMGATYLCSGKYDLAEEYLNKVAGMDDDFLLNQKKALLKIRTGNSIQSKEFLNKMENWILNKVEENDEVRVRKLMYEEALMEMEKDYLSNPYYIHILESLMRIFKEKRLRGFYLFYHDELKKAYCKQRKYKKALELEGSYS